MKTTHHHNLKGYIGLAVLVLIVLAVGLWAGDYPGYMSRFY